MKKFTSLSIPKQNQLPNDIQRMLKTLRKMARCYDFLKDEDKKRYDELNQSIIYKIKGKSATSGNTEAAST